MTDDPATPAREETLRAAAQGVVDSVHMRAQFADYNRGTEPPREPTASEWETVVSLDAIDRLRAALAALVPPRPDDAPALPTDGLAALITDILARTATSRQKARLILAALREQQETDGE